MPDLSSAESYRTWADLRDVLFEIVSLHETLFKRILCPKLNQNIIAVSVRLLDTLIWYIV